MTKKISCGLILHNNTHLLTVHPTFCKKWDIPKGEVNEDESFIDCVLREVYEETNLILPPGKLKMLSKFHYLSNKDLVLFSYYTNNLPSTLTMKCNSYFEKDGKQYKEVDKYLYHDFDKIEDWLWPNLGEIIKNLDLKK